MQFCGRFTNKRKLGQGGFGIVYLVQDNSGKEFALKVIPLDRMKRQPYLLNYLFGEIKCLKEMDSPYIVKLYETFEDKQNIYLLMEYCEGGNLGNHQAQQNDFVFPLSQATKILRDVVKGLEYLHKKGYLHRDLKPENVLVKMENGQEVFKLADFGFSKPVSQIRGTNLGTDNFKSPEVFQSRLYGYQVDMWAFGVLFFYMLNFEYPFKFGVYLSQLAKKKEIEKIAKNFSYERAVKLTKKKLVLNCSPEMEDLFNRIFLLDSMQRLTFADLREQPVFLERFPEGVASSKLLYSTIFQSKMLSENCLGQGNCEESERREAREEQEQFREKRPIGRGSVQPEASCEKQPGPQAFQQNVPVQMSRIIAASVSFYQQLRLLRKRKDEFDFLRDSFNIFLETGPVLADHEKLMLAYNLIKYYIILLKQTKHNLTVPVLSKLDPHLNWTQFLQSPQCSEFERELDVDLIDSEMKLAEAFVQCQLYINDIEKINEYFRSNCTDEITEKKVEGLFLESYKKSTVHVYKVLFKALKKNNKGNRLWYLLTMCVIMNFFDVFFQNKVKLSQILDEYLKEKGIEVEDINYSDLKMWLTKLNEVSFMRVAKKTIDIYFKEKS